MTSHSDAVLAVIPLLIVGGFVGNSLIGWLPATRPQSTTLVSLPLIAAVLAWVVVGHVLARPPTE